MLTRRFLIVVTITIFLTSLAAAEVKSIVVASTTSTEDSGLSTMLDTLLDEPPDEPRGGRSEPWC